LYLAFCGPSCREVWRVRTLVCPEWDLDPLLESWEFSTDEVRARLFVGADGREKLQMRLEMGILQMEADGRPDGRPPRGAESLLDYHISRLKASGQRASAEGPFTLTSDDCEALRQEALLYYHRYICLFCVRDFDRMERDTARNLLLANFLREQADSRLDRYSLEPYRAYIAMMNTRARCGQLVRDGHHGQALAAIEEGIRAIEEMLIGRGDADEITESGELAALRALTEEVNDARPRTLETELESRLEEALRREDYTAAARLRDMLATIRPADEAGAD